MNARLLKTLIAAVVIANFAGVVSAQEAKKDEEKKAPAIKSEVKEVQGEVSFIAKRSISVVFYRDKEKGAESEILLPLPKDVIIEHKKSLAEIKTGDIVSVKYLDETIDYGEKKENKITAKVIRFIRPADQDSVYRPKAVQAQDEGGLLPLKGAK
jgi:hypothetical protein